MRRQFALLAALGLSMLLGTGCSQDTAVSSPDGGLTLRVAERDGRIGYTLSRGEIRNFYPGNYRQRTHSDAVPAI